jgi:hypothetical protein
VAAQRIVVGDRGEHRGDVLADAPLRVPESWGAPVKTGRETRVREQVSLEGVLGDDRNGHGNRMAALDGPGHWNIPMQ